MTSDVAREKRVITISGVVLLFFMILITATANARFFTVLFSFLPAILSLVTLWILFDKMRGQFLSFAWVVPFVWPIVFYALTFAEGITFFQGIERENIIVLNFVLSFIPVVVIQLLQTSEHGFKGIMRDVKIKEPHDAKARGIVHHVHQLKETVNHLNAAIDRVYTKENGANKGMRNHITVPLTVLSKIDVHHPGRLHRELWTFSEHLTLLYRSEIEVFGQGAFQIKNLARDPEGRTRVIDVLIANYPHPVASHFKQALELCKLAIEETELLR